jgi:hypothetical protein
MLPLHQQEAVLPSSAASPLSAAFGSPKIPLPAGWPNRIQVSDKQRVFDDSWTLFGG